MPSAPKKKGKPGVAKAAFVLPTKTIKDAYPNVLDVPFDKIFEYWHDYTKNGRDIVAVRALALWDRFFLLVQIFGRRDLLHPWLFARCREVERSPDGYLDLWAREHYKSTIITFAGTIQEALRNPEITIGIFSHTGPIAKSFLKQIKQELERNERLQDLFPDVLYKNPYGEAPSWSLDGGLILRRKSNPKEATFEAHGLVDGQPTSKHFSLLVYDDVVVKESVSTSEQVAKTTEAWELSDNLGASGGRKWHIGTRWSYADTYDAILKKEILKVRLHPATDDGTFTGNPVLLTPEALRDKKIAQGEAVFACQMLQDPLAGQNRMFDVADIQDFEIRPATLSIYIMCDPARSKKKDSALTAMSVIGIDYALNKYLLDGYNHQMDLKERWEHFARLYVRWSAMPGVQIVRMGYEVYGAQADMDYFLEQMQKPDNPRFEIVELAWPREGPGSKIDRIQRLGPDFRAHKFFVPYNTDPKALTRNQANMEKSGYSHRVAQRIRKKDKEGNMYDLVAQFKEQVHYFPYGGLKDLVDAASRLYDMEPRAPVYNEPRYVEPEYT